MKKIVPFYYRITSALDHYGKDIPLLAIRIILAYAFFGPAMMKWGDMESTIMWFGNEEWS